MTRGDWKAGDVILDLYEVLGVAGRGGMGVVHRVRHREWGIDLAVKSPLPGAAAERTLEREAEAWIDLGLHPHVCACHYVRRINGTPRIFAEFVEGGTLGDRIREGSLYGGGVDRLLEPAIGFADGLDYAHAQGLVHQDVKPGNVLLDGAGDAKVTDFGIARAGVRPVEAVADPQVSVGGMTPAYRSPEQAAGARVTAATDVWSFAVSLLELFMGHLPSPEGQAAPQVLAAFLRREAFDPAIPVMPHQLADLLARCLRREPAARPAMGEVAAMLRDIMRDATGRDHTASPVATSRLMAGEQNNRALSMLDLGREPAAEYCWREALRADPHHPDATYNLALYQWRRGEIADDAVIARLETVRMSHEPDWHDEYLLALAHMERGDHEAAQSLLQALPQDEPEVIAARAAPPAGLLEYERSLACHAERLSAVAIGGAGHVVICGDIEGRVLLSDDASGGVEELGTGTRLAPGAGVQQLAHRGPVVSAAISADAGLGLTGDNTGLVVLWDIPGRRMLRTLAGHDGGVAVALADTQVAITGAADGVRLWDLDREAPARTLDESSAEAVGISGDGRFAVAARDDVITWYLESRSGTLTGHDDRVSALAIAADGRRVVAGSGNRLVVWDEGKPARALSGHGGPIVSLALSADGRIAVSASSLLGGMAVRLWDLNDGRCLRTLPGDDFHGLAHVAVDPTGAVAVIGDWAGELRRYRVGRPRRSRWAYSRPRKAVDAVAVEAALRTELDEIDELERAFELDLAVDLLRELRADPSYARDARVLERWARIGAWGWRSAAIAAYRQDWTGREDQGSGALSWPTRGGVFLLVARQSWRLDAWSGTLSVVRGKTRILSAQSGELWDWDARERACRRVGALGRSFRTAAVSADGRLGLAVTQDGLAVLLDLQNGAEVRRLAGKSRGCHVALSADGGVALVGEENGTARLWDVESAEEIGAYNDQGNDGGRVTVALSADGELAITSGAAGVVCRRWRSGGTTTIATELGLVRRLAVTADGRHVLATESADRYCGLYDTSDGRRLVTMPQSEPVSKLALTPAGDFALILGRRGGAALWTIDWDFEFSADVDWDARVRPVVEAFLRLRVPYAARLASGGPIRSGPPDVSNIDDLYNHHLQTAGLGWPTWLRAEEVSAEVERLVARWPTAERRR